jgi:DNA-binding SARP family transcriptional activator
MSQLEIHLFGKFTVRCDEITLSFFKSQKVQELFCYLLLFHDRAHHREKLADIIWGQYGSKYSKQYLRKTLCKLKASLRAIPNLRNREILLTEPEWLQINLGAGIWVDVAEFERVFNLVSSVRGRNLDDQKFTALQNVDLLYKGDLLEGCYQDWCVFERERYREMLFTIFHKMMGYCEATNKFDLGIKYGKEILRYERANERTHRRIMRLYYQAGDRTAALNQYDYLGASLDEELAVKPSKRTTELYHQILSENDEGILRETKMRESEKIAQDLPVKVSLGRIKRLISEQAINQEKLLQEIQTLATALKYRS